MPKTGLSSAYVAKTITQWWMPDDLHPHSDTAASREWLTTLESVCSRETAASALNKFLQLAQQNVDRRLEASIFPDPDWQEDIYMKTECMGRPD